MQPIHSFAVRPRMPERLSFLNELAYNIWWDWNFDAVDLFRRLSPRVWEQSGQNPIDTLQRTEQQRFDYLSREPGFLNHLERVKDAFHVYLSEPRWFQRTYPDAGGLSIAYFSAEFGLTRSLQIYSGGLGILAGDILKSSSDMGLPLTGIGLAYRLGYFHQYMSLDGWQQERYLENDFRRLPIERVLDSAGSWLSFDIPDLGRPVTGALWRVNVGRVPLYLITTNLPQNHPDDRAITDQLYGGDRETRIRQEIVLGIGGKCALRALGVEPTVCHMNEGHSAFLALEEIRNLMRPASSGGVGLDFGSAFELASARNCFTTHTPVPAGNDVFEESLLRKYFDQMSKELGCGWDSFLELGQDSAITNSSQYCMTVVALKTAQHNNAVSELHGGVSRTMWQTVWPDLPQDEVPIFPVTNGIHTYSWISPDMGVLFDRYLGTDWRRNPLAAGLWDELHNVPEEELWRVHERRRTRLVVIARQRLERQLRARGASQDELEQASEVLNPEALTIGFARRFATYKRATLLLRDPERLQRLLHHRQQPVQFIFAGKAHPRDDEGKKLIRELIHAAHDSGLRTRFVFLEDYDMSLSRYMLQGVDVWLNTPRRPLEASGTSGMKAVANGAIHLSTLDGWWAEAYAPGLGWAIGKGEDYSDTAYQDQVEGEALYELLENEIVPLFFRRNVADLPSGWVELMKRSMSALIPRFASHRMVRDYLEQSYLPAHACQERLAEIEAAGARELAGWRSRVLAGWDKVQIESVSDGAPDEELEAGGSVLAGAIINPGLLQPDDLCVEVYHGEIAVNGELNAAEGTAMELEEILPDGQLRYSLSLQLPLSGFYGYTVRVYPAHRLLGQRHALARMKWAKPGNAAAAES